MTLGGTYSPTDGWDKLEDSFTIQFPFKGGYRYNITMYLGFDDIDQNMAASGRAAITINKYTALYIWQGLLC